MKMLICGESDNLVNDTLQGYVGTDSTDPTLFDYIDGLCNANPALSFCTYNDEGHRRGNDEDNLLRLFGLAFLDKWQKDDVWVVVQYNDGTYTIDNY